MSTKSKKLLSVVGLGYVGLPLAVEFAKNREVVAFDINADRVKQLKGFNDVTGECSDKEIKAAKKIKFTNNDADLDGIWSWTIWHPDRGLVLISILFT